MAEGGLGNPFKSEAEMFRVLVVVLVAAVPVIAAAVLVGTVLALIVLGIELVVGIVSLRRSLRTRRAGPDEPAG